MSACVVKNGWLIVPSELNEKTTFPADADVPPVLKFELMDLKTLNSYGLRVLIQFVRMYKDRPLEYHNCPVNFVETLNIVRELLGPSRDGSAVKSLALPYHCDDCNRFDGRIVVAKSIDMNDKNFGQPPFPCSSCGQPMIIDVLEGEYLEFF